MLYLLPHLPIQIIFQNLCFHDILNLTKVPLFRTSVLDFYKRESNRKDLVKMCISELVLDVCNRPNIVSRELDFYKLGMKLYNTTQKYYEIQKECVSQLLPEEIDSIVIGNRKSLEEKREFLENHLEIVDFYDFFLNIMNITVDRKRELCSIFYCKGCEQTDHQMKHMKDFVMNQISDKDGFNKLLKIVEIFIEYISLTVTMQDFYKQILKRLDIIESMFYQ